MNKEYAIVTDGSCDLPKELCQEKGITVVPFYVSFDGEKYEKEIVEGTYYEYILTDTIANIQIISLTAYDESHPAGTDVNELFMDYPLRQEDQLTDYKYGYMYGTVFYKIPRTLPQAGVHRFKVVVTTCKGEEFTKETDEITMQ